MNLSPNQIRANARQFSLDWQDAVKENAESQTFWNEFFAVFGINRRKIGGLFEMPIKKQSGTQGRIDVFWKKRLLCEQKSRGEDLDKAITQALGYLQSLDQYHPDDFPRYVIVCDFQTLKLLDTQTEDSRDIQVADLAEHIELFGFMSGYEVEFRAVQEATNIQAAEKMGKLHDQLELNGYDGHPLKVMLIRLLFCMFAEDTGIFDRYQFEDLISKRTREDGSDLAGWLSQLFDTLNRDKAKRFKNLDEQLNAFEYINGELFAETMPPAAFDAGMRHEVITACQIDWRTISPEIFGALFQSVMKKEERRNLGAHYTNEENILKVVNSLLMDELRAEFELIKARRQSKVRADAWHVFHHKISSLTFLDPACGCGNFLIVAYRELRLLELALIEEIQKDDDQLVMDVGLLIRCNVNQFYGIEIEEFPSQIARVAMWLVDHQMNMEVSRRFGMHYARIPLKQSAHVENANALQVEWPVTDFILGNPPFLGYTQQSTAQKIDLSKITHDIHSGGKLDFVCGWYVKAARLMSKNPNTRSAFVSTNSICQGEQVPILWSWMLAQGVHIQFAHRTFVWQSSAKGKAAVHCVIVGFGLSPTVKKTIFEYENGKGEPTAINASNINPYLVDSNTLLIQNMRQPICAISIMKKGSQPTDGGNLLLSDAEKIEFIAKEPLAEKYIRPFLGSEEMINNIKRWCLWLKNLSPSDLKKMPHTQARLDAVQNMRLASSKEATRKWAVFPTLFTENRQPESNYLAIPEVSSENRLYLPIGFLDASIIASNKLYTISNATLYEFGVMTSLMHNAWMRTVTGRLKSDYQYSAGIVYNNFPWPLDPTIAQKTKIETAAQAVLDARAAHPTSSLAALYDPLSMPPNLTRAHQQLDKAVDAAYGKTKFNTEAERVAFLFERYQHYTAPTAPVAATAKPKTRAKKSV